MIWIKNKKLLTISNTVMGVCHNNNNNNNDTPNGCVFYVITTVSYLLLYF